MEGPDLLLPAAHYLFVLPSDEPSAAGILRRHAGFKPGKEERTLEEWAPTFVLYYAKPKELRRASQELIAVNGRLFGEYTFTEKSQMAFIFQRRAADGLELLGGMTLDIINVPQASIMHHHPWGLALVPEGGVFPQDVAAFYPGSHLLRFIPPSEDDGEGKEYNFPTPEQ